ncbi:MAG: hypothetical protein HY842_09475 [Bacteroidetes bacterium]|nr:hypothetical protein [Bacteroidota bacterium]
MKRQLLTCAFFSLCWQAKAQLGVTAATTQSSSPEWQVVTENFITHRRSDFLRYGTTVITDYAFPLKNEAIRLRPALHYMRSTAWYYPHYFQASVIGLQANIEFALWGEVDKQGRPTLFRPFVQLSPGLSLASLRYDSPKGDGGPFQGEYVVHSRHRLAPNAGANLLLEFKLSELLTVAPLAGVRFYPNLLWKDFTETVSDGQMTGTFDRTNWRQFVFGLRMGLTFMKK